MYKEVKYTAYECVCDNCGHEWLALEFPKRCAGKRKCRNWNTADRKPELRTTVPVRAVESGTDKPEAVRTPVKRSKTNPPVIRKNLCVLHNKPWKDYGTKWVCDGPPQHTEAK
jgi:hypothetical protein